MGDVTGSRQPARPGGAPSAKGDATRRPYLGTPNAERYVIAADNLRRRQLKSALLHGSGRTWREQRRIWPGVAAGVVVVAVIVAAIAVVGAFRTERELQRREASGVPPGPALHGLGDTPPSPTAILPRSPSLEMT